MIVITKPKFKIDKHIKTALMVSICIGTVLNIINSFDVIISRQVTLLSISKIVLTYITPFCVSLYSSKKKRINSSINMWA